MKIGKLTMKMKTVFNDYGSISLIAILLVLGISILSISSFTNSYLKGNIVRNQREKIKSFYAADGEMVRLVQEMNDQHRTNYYQIVDSLTETLLTLQAENAIISGATVTNASWTGYRGTGFVDYIHSSGDTIKWDFLTSTSGSYNAVFRYALGNTNPRPMLVVINGIEIDNALSFTNTGSWNKWNYVFINFKLLPGKNIIMLIANGNSGPNVDQLAIVKGGNGSGSSQFGDYKVNWVINETKTNHFQITTNAFLENKPEHLAFNTNLEQMLEVSSDAFVAPGDTVKVPVTFYDFHSDRTNPEFECPAKLGRHRNMVGNKLDADRKPALGSYPHRNYYIKYWFRPWADFAKGDFTIPQYHDLPENKKQYYKNDKQVEYTGIDDSTLREPNFINVGHDTSFKNIVIHDSLTFYKISDDGMYELRSSAFFILDHRGFGNEWVQDDINAYVHNFSFTMELHTTFTKLPGQVFIFTGDDDVWLFINDSLVMDIGGIHGPESDTLLLDNIPGLVNGETYNFDFFYCERHSGGSTILIQTNLLTKLPENTNRRLWRRNYGNID
jgi:fibro-slime domain-containing protein